MRKNLLIAFFATFSMFAFSQTVWNVGNDIVNFPVNAGVSSGNEVTVNGLTIVAGGSTVNNMGQVEANAKTFNSPTTSTDYTFINRFKFNGAGLSTSDFTNGTPTKMMPTQRYLKINVSGNSSIYMIGISGSGTAERKLFITDGNAIVGSVVFPLEPDPADATKTVAKMVEGTINYTGGATTLYIFCNAAINLYYISATNAVVTSTSSVSSNKTIVSEKYFDVLGHEIRKDSKGLIIRKITYNDGTSTSFKNYVSWER